MPSDGATLKNTMFVGVSSAGTMVESPGIFATPRANVFALAWSSARRVTW